MIRHFTLFSAALLALLHLAVNAETIYANDVPGMVVLDDSTDSMRMNTYFNSGRFSPRIQQFSVDGLMFANPSPSNGNDALAWSLDCYLTSPDTTRCFESDRIRELDLRRSTYVSTGSNLYVTENANGPDPKAIVEGFGPYFGGQSLIARSGNCGLVCVEFNGLKVIGKYVFAQVYDSDDGSFTVRKYPLDAYTKGEVLEEDAVVYDYSGDGSELLYFRDKGLRITSSSELLLPLAFWWDIAARLSGNGQVIVVTSRNGIWWRHTAEGSEWQLVVLNHRHITSDVLDISPSGRFIALTSQWRLTGDRSKHNGSVPHVYIYDIIDGDFTLLAGAESSVNWISHPSAGVFSPHGHLLIWGLALSLNPGAELQSRWHLFKRTFD